MQAVLGVPEGTGGYALREYLLGDLPRKERCRLQLALQSTKGELQAKARPGPCAAAMSTLREYPP